jgi:hypothetical protein
MKKIISKIVFGSFVVGSMAFVQAQKIDAKAKKILDDVTANYKSKKNSYFKFAFGSGVNGVVSKNEPGIYYSAGDKYKLKIMETEQIFWADYRPVYKAGLAPGETGNLQLFDQVLGFGPPASDASGLSPTACRSALFIMLYRGYPMLQTPFQLLNSLLEIDEQMSTWRYRHMSMVHRTIGGRIGTGGSTGRDYLKGALDKHYIFSGIARLTSFLIERSRLPVLSREMEQRLGFGQAFS